jgi:pyruvate/2-oxoglutarate dehydrogenase complex dihydrolipoamide dehydrogenase (E3) component
MKENYFDIIVIGAGSGGLNIAGFMNRVGFKVLLIDKSDENIGGDCLNFGCVPSKALIHIARLVKDAHKAKDFGIDVGGVTNMRKVRDYIKNKQDVIREHENAEYFRSIGMTVIFGDAKFVSKDEVNVNGVTYKSKKIVIATGSRPRPLNIEGSEKLNIYTNEEIFNIEELPKRLLVIGGGPIGIEIGQAFNYLGSEVSVLQRGNKLLPKEDGEIANIFTENLKKEGVELYFNSEIKEILNDGEVVVKSGTEEKMLSFDAVFVAIGRELNTEGLDLEKAGIEMDGRKIKVNKYLRTTNRDVYLCGDIVGGHQFTHAAELHAGIILRNFFSPFKKKYNPDNLSWVTYASPEIATFGLNDTELKKRGVDYSLLESSFDEDDRAIVDDFSDGKVKLFVSKSGKLLGGTMIAPNAGELFQELVLVNTLGLKISSLFNKTYPYPTATRINKRVVSQYFSGKLTFFNKKILRFLFH